MALSTFTWLCDHHHQPSPELFILQIYCYFRVINLSVLSALACDGVSGVAADKAFSSAWSLVGTWWPLPTNKLAEEATGGAGVQRWETGWGGNGAWMERRPLFCSSFLVLSVSCSVQSVLGCTHIVCKYSRIEKS